MIYRASTLLLDVTGQLEKATGEQTLRLFKNLEKLEESAIMYAPKLLLAALLFFVGKWFINRVSKLLKKAFRKREFDPSLQSFLISIVRISLIVLLLLTIISILGINITSFAALLAGAGLAIGGALNGSLGNFAGGVMILILKPFKVGDLIEAQGFFGIVKEIGIVDTTILTAQNKTVHLPNGALSTGVITNYTNQEDFRIDIRVPVADCTDFDKARSVAIEAMLSHPNVLKNPAPDVKIVDLTGDGPVLVLWPRIEIKDYDTSNPRKMEADYYSVFFGIRELVYKAFVKNGIQTPDSTLQVTMKN